MSTHPDLLDVVDSTDWFATIALPAPSSFDDSAARFEIEWKNARRQLSDRWDSHEIEALDGFVADIPHDGGPALVLICGRGGATFAEFLDEPVQNGVVHEDALPRLATLIEGRQRTIPHVVVETDRTGADLTAFDGGDVLSTDQVSGETHHIHRGAPGGWSQRRFQQRAENIWEQNGKEVADAVASLARDVDARLIAVAGDVRAQGIVLEALPSDVADRAVRIEEGSPDGIADHVVRLLSSQVAERATELAEAVRAGLASDLATVDSDEVLRAALDGRVETLLVHDDDLDTPTTTEALGDIPAGVRVVDAAIVAALRTDATVFVVPNLATMEGPVAALLRW
ncbi:hypothetical protein BH23ACT3_BH23ACT3_15970 [soil metagenome]